MQCARCQHDNPSDAAFCQECGSHLEAACPSCGTPNQLGAKFCKKCGQRLSHPEAAPAVPGPRVSSPESYTPKHLAEKILTTKSALEGERKQVTVLFCDIVDSSQLAERLEPEAMHEVMDGALRLMAEAVHRYEGTVNQFLGDGLMALFGAPVALEDHAFRAVQAALAIRETLGGYSQQLELERGVKLRLRQGLNTGLVVVGRIGDDLRMDYTAVGDTTHLASRVQALAEPDTILLTEATHRLVEGYIRSEALGPVVVKGRSEPVPVYQVIGRRRRRTRLEVSAERGLTQLVGRERELGLLHECFARAKAGRGQVVGIVGEPGVGKSRLLYEFRKSLEGERVTWLEGHCVAYGQTTPYLPILEILRTNFQVEEGDNLLQIQEKLRQGVHRLDPALEGILPFLHDLFSIPGAEAALKHLDPKDKRQKTFEAIRTLTLAGSQRRLHVLILEDLHWIDKTSEDYLTVLTAALAGASVLILTTQRPGYTLRWADKTYYTQIALDVLTEGETEALVAALLASRHLPSDLIRIVRGKAEGNPLFVEEITTSLLERGMLVRRNGEILWTGGSPVEVPATIQDIVRARLDRLEEPVKRMVQVAAVIGREFGLRLLTRISEMTVEIQHYLDTLKHLEFIHETRFFPEVEYIFKHAVTQDVAYQSLLAQRRKELHGTIGQAMEDLYADRLTEQAVILAYHYARSTHRDKAVTYALLAGDHAVRLHARAEATTQYAQALSLARELPESPEAQRLRIDAVLKLAAVGASREDMERDQAHLSQAHALAKGLGDEPRLAQILYWQGRLAYVRGDMQTAIPYAEQSLALADRLADETLSAPPVNLLGRIHTMQWECARGSQLLARSTAQMHQLGNRAEEATAAGFAGVAFGFLGEFASALPHADRGVEIARDLHDPYAEAAALHYRSMVYDQQGAWEQALTDWDTARRLAEGVGDRFRVYVVSLWSGWAATKAGNPALGRGLLEQALALADQLGTSLQVALGNAFLAACQVALGDVDTVPSLCLEGLQTADRLARAVASRALAGAVSRGTEAPLPEAERAMGDATRLFKELGFRPELARSYVCHARLLQPWGQRETARRYLSEAIVMFRDMGMAWDLERAEQELRELGE
jgi:class 3 adenylate cyclase/tetratricopeptide (TPR) repeat protein